jgi:hypothetical protein
MTALLILVYTESPAFFAAGGFFIALAVGCRPFYFFMIPFYGFHAFKRFPSLKTFIFIIIGLIPPGLFMMIYNAVRFGSIAEFGHKYLPWSKTLSEGVFSFSYFPRNIYHALVHGPEWDRAKDILSFSGAGTGLWFSSPVLLLGLFFFFSPLSILFIRFVNSLPEGHLLKKIFQKYLGVADKKINGLEILISGITLFVIWFGLLLHESGGWYQFGYRFSVDLIPLLLFFFGRTFKKPYLFLVPLCQCAVIINIYGALWFYILRLS